MGRLLSRLTSWYFSKRALPYWCVLALDCLIVLFGYYVGCYVERGGSEFLHSFGSMSVGALLCIVLFLVSFRLFRTYSGIIRYSSFVDLQQVVLSSVLGSVLTFVASLLLTSVEPALMPG